MVGELLPAVSSRGMIQNLNLDSTKLKVQGTWASGRLEEYVVLMCLYMHSCIYKCSQCPWQLLNSKAGKLLQQSLHLTTAYMDLALAFYKRPGQRSG